MSSRCSSIRIVAFLRHSALVQNLALLQDCRRPQTQGTLRSLARVFRICRTIRSGIRFTLELLIILGKHFIDQVRVVKVDKITGIYTLSRSRNKDLIRLVNRLSLLAGLTSIHLKACIPTDSLRLTLWRI